MGVYIPKWDTSQLLINQSKRLRTQCSLHGDNCNYENLDTSKCQQDEEYGSFWPSFGACLYDSDGAYYELQCNEDLTEITCDGVLALYKQAGKCLCQTYAKLYDRISSASKSVLEVEIDRSMKQFNEYNDILECDINLVCDLADGGNVYQPGEEESFVDNKVYFIALLWAISVYIIG